MEGSKIFILDSSVIIKWFTQEKSRDSALNYRTRFVNGEIDIIVPDLLLYEIANALRYNPNFNEKDVSDAIESLFEIGIEILVPTKQIVTSAINIAFKHRITVYDAYYVALATELAYTFVTADMKLYDKIKRLKFVRSLTD